MKRSIKPLLTGDGSYTLEFQEINEHYHSMDGAISESQYVFIENGLDLLKSKVNISVLEIGLGTGYNALLSYKWANSNQCKISYQSLEPYPLDSKTFEFIGQNLATLSDVKDEYFKIHTSQEQEIRLSPGFEITTSSKAIQDYSSRSSQFDIIFFDAFAPSRQADIWSFKIFEKCFELLKPNGMIVSYNASGIYKRGLLNAGFELIRKQGFSSKREMFSGIKKADANAPAS